MQGNDAIRRAAEEYRREQEAAQPRAAPYQKQKVEQPAAPARVRLARGSDVEMKPIRWLWPGWLARGKLHILAGMPAAGKTTLALSLGAVPTCGRNWPDGAPCLAKGNVIIWSGEDAAEDTLCPRFAAMGGDLNRFFVVGGVVEGDRSRAFDPAKDMGALAGAIDEIGGASIVVVDPIVSAVSGDSHKNSETRRGLQPLVDLAAKFDAAIIGVSHFSKGTSGRDPVDRLTGSLAFGALARVVMVAACSQGDDAPPRVLARAKSNIGPDGGGFAFGLATRPVGAAGIDAQLVEWGEKLEGTAREILAQAEGQPDVETVGKAAEAETLIRSMLAGGPMDSATVFDRCAAAGISKKTAYRAKSALGVEAKKRGFGAGWIWELPAGNGAEDGQELPEDGQHAVDLATFAKKPGKPGVLRRFPLATFVTTFGGDTVAEDGQDAPKMANEDGHWPPSQNINKTGASSEGGQASQSDVDLTTFGNDEWGEL